MTVVITNGTGQRVELSEGLDEGASLVELRANDCAWLTRDPCGGWVPVPPFDETLTVISPLVNLPRSVNVRWAWTYIGSPFGDLAVLYRVKRGQLVELDISQAPVNRAEVDVWFEFPYQRALSFRLRDIDVFDMVGPPADIGGDITVAMMVAGLVDDSWLNVVPASSSALRCLVRAHEALNGRCVHDLFD